MSSNVLMLPYMSTAMEHLAGRFQQGRPYRSPGQAAVIGLLAAADRVRRGLDALVAELADITGQQFNVLRILRGAGSEGLPTLEVAARMIEQTPGATRMMDRLEAKGLIDRCRGTTDRRQVWCRISPEGLALLDRLDEPLRRFEDDLTAGRSDAEWLAFLDTLEHLDPSAA